MGLDFITGIISLLTLICVWLFLKPQQAENKAFHESLNRISQAIDNLTSELQQSREDRVAIKKDIKSLWNRYGELRETVDALNAKMLMCQGEGCQNNRTPNK
ncbi:hypothetical protein EVA_12901 [gut metagenome]|uniref:Uncharacterized protein n=1 Tax=gut metagenome TaxID=749906 RepID=J9GB33_9ZZZZ